MRSIPLMAATLVTLALATGCGGDNNTGPNNPPVADFTAACTGTACQFTDKSTDDNGVASREWDFGDLSAKSTDANPAHTYPAAGDYTVTLTVKDAAGESNAKSQTVHVTTGTNQQPVASFDLPATCTAGTPCGFHSTSTDPDGTIASASWNFGDLGEPGSGPDATHTYAAAGTYTVTLTVTDNLGLTGTASQQISVSPATSQDCVTTGTQVNCTLGITQRSTVTFTLTSRSCELAGNKLNIVTPVPQAVFSNICSLSVGQTAEVTVEAGTLGLRFIQGIADVGDPATGDPGIQIEATSPTSWTLKIDDGGNAGALGEPDFDDAVIDVVATPAP